MYRRSLFAALVPTLAGCSLAPSDPSTEAYPTSGPNIFVSFDWDPDRSTLIVTFDRGNRVTPENTGRLFAVTPDANDVETVWVDRDGTNSVSEFPLTPGATLIHEIPEPRKTRLVWVAPEQQASRVVAVWQLETSSPEDSE